MSLKFIAGDLTIHLSLLKNLSDLGVRSSATIERRDFGPTTGPFEICAPRLQRVGKGRISLTQPRPMDCGGSGRGIGNRIRHEYFRIDDAILWEIITTDVPSCPQGSVGNSTSHSPGTCRTASEMV
jgi:Protein of unknown function DUF86